MRLLRGVVLPVWVYGDSVRGALSMAVEMRSTRSAVRPKQFLTYVSSGPFQYAVAEALALPESYFTAFREDMRAKRDLLASGLTEAGFEVFRTAGTYFITTGIRSQGETDGFAFCHGSRSASAPKYWWPGCPVGHGARDARL